MELFSLKELVIIRPKTSLFHSAFPESRALTFLKLFEHSTYKRVIPE